MCVRRRTGMRSGRCGFFDFGRPPRRALLAFQTKGNLPSVRMRTRAHSSAHRPRAEEGGNLGVPSRRRVWKDRSHERAPGRSGASDVTANATTGACCGRGACRRRELPNGGPALVSPPLSLARGGDDVCRCGRDAPSREDSEERERMTMQGPGAMGSDRKVSLSCSPARRMATRSTPMILARTPGTKKGWPIVHARRATRIHLFG